MNNFEEMLAEQVRLYRHLYDPSMRAHRDSQMAKNSWREIAATVGKEESVCKKVWKNLRDQFEKAKKRVHGKSGDPAGFKHASPILSELGWLSQFVKHRETDSTMEYEEEGSVAPNHWQESSSRLLKVDLAPSLSAAPTCTTSPCSDTSFPQSISVRSPKSLPGSACKRKRNTKDVLLNRLERLDQEREMARQQNNEDYRCGVVIADMLSKVTLKRRRV
ncbi:transcription factor Adf-1-like [Sinocyclocheilus rhinocerous]|uniref:transcription factor Adf-1-like n=1 Tax=Sinocyclocheilus rhinocerous TaxID=307959 RepID=UPI0007BA74B3|nr:PREDICTED: transcription factor Adf-1-like [Sinocyclocheilus rhinocerous]